MVDVSFGARAARFVGPGGVLGAPRVGAACRWWLCAKAQGWQNLENAVLLIAPIQTRKCLLFKTNFVFIIQITNTKARNCVGNWYQFGNLKSSILKHDNSMPPAKLLFINKTQSIGTHSALITLLALLPRYRIILDKE